MNKDTTKIGNFTVLKKSEHILHINDGTPSFVTLILGEKHALLVDTSWGVQDLRGLVEKIVSTPYTVVNTHGHPDHCYGNFQFDEVLVPELDVDVYSEIQNYAFQREEFIKNDEQRIKFEPKNYPPLKTLKTGDRFDLGGITVDAVPLYSHTHGSLGYLVNEEKILVAGDAINTNVWLFMKESLPLEDCIKTYENAKNFGFEKILGSHAKVFWTKEMLDVLILNLKKVLSPDYIFEAENHEKIMGYETSRSYAEFKNSGGYIVVPDRQNFS